MAPARSWTRDHWKRAAQDQLCAGNHIDLWPVASGVTRRAPRAFEAEQRR